MFAKDLRPDRTGEPDPKPGQTAPTTKPEGAPPTHNID